jgi:hypothetical protein
MLMPLPEAMIAVWAPFAALFTQPVWHHVQVLWRGAVLCRGPRTVASVLRVMGLGGERRFEKYHRVLNRARWSGLQGAKILLGLLIALLPASWDLEIVVDETIERRKGQRIHAKGRYRDAVRSTKGTVVKCYGLKWISLMLLAPLPWSTRPWALPILTLLAPSERANTKAKRRHKTTVDWTVQAVKVITRWLGGRRWTLIGDGGYACVHLAHVCVARGVTLISRLRLDAQLYAFPDRNAPRRRGPKPLKGKRLPSLKERVQEALAYGKDLEIPWYGGTTRRVRVLSNTSLWYTPGERPVAIRWVLIVDPNGEAEPMAVFTTDLDQPVAMIIAAFVRRWNIEVTFEETRRHLGVETQRQWADLAIARTTPALFALFSLVCLMAHRLVVIGQALPIRATAWYRKSEATFSDVLAMVSRVLWAEKYFMNSINQPEPHVLTHEDWEVLLDQLASTA